MSFAPAGPPIGGGKETARHHFLMRKAKKLTKQNGRPLNENYEVVRQEQEEVMAQKMYARGQGKGGGKGWEGYEGYEY